MTAPPRSSGCSGSHHSSALQSPELHTRIYSASVNNSPGARSAMTVWKPATQASTDRRSHGPEVEILNLVDDHPLLKDHDPAQLSPREPPQSQLRDSDVKRR